MIKRILAGTIGALVLVGCGGSSNSGTAFVYGVNADPNVGNVSILANGSTVLSGASYASSSSSFVNISSGANAAVYVTNSTGQQLAGTTYLSGFTTGNYYNIYAYGSSSNQSIAILPVDVSLPINPTDPGGTYGRIMFTNTSVYQPSVDVYVTTQSSVAGLTPTVSGLTAFNSGFTTEKNNIAPNTYNVIFTTAGTQNVIATVSGLNVSTVTSGSGENLISVVGITDAQGTTTPALQQALTPIIFQPVSGAIAPSANVRPMIIKGSKPVAPK
ncbi:MAG: hypothetical protein P4L46_19865 [Fimbriimonas sp.]|nr:hypothetical protein [Fimbriimonas sp.]